MTETERIKELETENASLKEKAKHLAAILLLDMSALVDYQRPDEDVFDCITRLRDELEQSRKFAKAWKDAAKLYRKGTHSLGKLVANARFPVYRKDRRYLA